MPNPYEPLEYETFITEIVRLADKIHTARGAYYRDNFETLNEKVKVLQANYTAQCKVTNKNSYLPKVPGEERIKQIVFIVKIAEALAKSLQKVSIEASKLPDDAAKHAKELAEMRARDVLLGAILHRYMRLKSLRSYFSCDLFLVLESLLNLKAPGVKPIDDFTLLSCYQAFYDYLYKGMPPTSKQFEYIEKDTDFKKKLEEMIGIETDKESLRSKCAIINYQMNIIAILHHMVIQLAEDETLIMNSYEKFKLAIKNSNYSYTSVSSILIKGFGKRFTRIVLDAWPVDDDVDAIAELQDDIDGYFKPRLTTVFQYPLLAMCFLIKNKLPETVEYSSMRKELTNILNQTRTNEIKAEDARMMMVALQNYRIWPDGARLDVSPLWKGEYLFEADIKKHITEVQEDEVNEDAFQLS